MSGKIKFDPRNPNKEFTLSNGAIGSYVDALKKDGTPYKRFQIFQGAPAEYLEEVNPRTNPGRPISKERARKAAVAYYNRHLKRGKFASQRGKRSSMTYDSNRTGERGPVVTDARYLLSPWKYDYAGLDDLDNKPSRTLPADLVPYQYEAGTERQAESLALAQAARRGEYTSARRARNKAQRAHEIANPTRRKPRKKSKARKPRGPQDRGPRISEIPEGVDAKAARQHVINEYRRRYPKNAAMMAGRDLGRSKAPIAVTEAERDLWYEDVVKWDLPGIDTYGSEKAYLKALSKAKRR